MPIHRNGGHVVKIFIFVICFLYASSVIYWGWNQITPVWTSISRFTSTTISDDDNQLKKIIENEAKKKYIPPINARIDKVWKAIPGYNGIELDQERTFSLAKHENLSFPSKWFTREVEPTIQLEDLGPYPIYKGNPNKPMVAFMVNVAWGNEHIAKILKTFEENNVKATFFLDGSWLEKNEEISRKIVKAGHEISNHGYHHKMMSKLSRIEAFTEINSAQQLLYEKLQVSNSFFAPPSGDFNQETIEIARELKLFTVLWTFDTIDWRNPTPEHILRRFSSQIEPGLLVLMHPTSSSSHALPQMIQLIKEKGLHIGTVSQTLSSKRVFSEN